MSAASDSAAHRASSKASSPAVAGNGASTSSAYPPSAGVVVNSYNSRVKPASFDARAATRYLEPGVRPVKDQLINLILQLDIDVTFDFLTYHLGSLHLQQAHLWHRRLLNRPILISTLLAHNHHHPKC